MTVSALNNVVYRFNASRSGVKLIEYLADILLRVQNWPHEHIDDLLPASWLRLKEAGQLPPLNPA